MLKYVGPASIRNAGVALTDSGGNDQITPLNFTAYVKGNQSAVAGEQATTGHFDTPANFRIFINNKIVTE